MVTPPGTNPLFARPRKDKRVTRDGLTQDFDDAEALLSRGSFDDDGLVRVYPCDDGLDVLIAYQHRHTSPRGSRHSDDIANGIVITAVLDLVQDHSLPADAKSLNFIPSRHVHTIHNVHTRYLLQMVGSQQKTDRF